MTTTLTAPAPKARGAEVELIRLLLAEPSLTRHALRDIPVGAIQHVGLRQVLATMFAIQAGKPDPVKLSEICASLDHPRLAEWVKDQFFLLTREAPVEFADRIAAYRKLLGVLAPKPVTDDDLWGGARPDPGPSYLKIRIAPARLVAVFGWPSTDTYAWRSSGRYKFFPSPEGGWALANGWTDPEGRNPVELLDMDVTRDDGDGGPTPTAYWTSTTPQTIQVESGVDHAERLAFRDWLLARCA